jgi:hypothetical protein
MKIVSVLTLLFFAFFPTSFLCWGYTTCSYSMTSFLSQACRQPLSRQYPSPNNRRKEFPRMSVQNLPCNLPIKDATMHLVHGRRCLLIPSRHSHLLSPKEGGGSLKPFAWSIILATYSDRFLAKNGPEKVSSWVEHICFNHILIQMGLLSLLQQTGELEPIELADQIVRCRCSKTQIQLAVGGDDKISTCDQVEKLRVALELDNSVLIYKDCGHAVLNERAVRWRKDALEFLNR